MTEIIGQWVCGIALLGILIGFVVDLGHLTKDDSDDADDD